MSSVPLTRQQHRLWLQRVLNPASSAYNVATALRFRGDLDLDALGRAWAAVVARHEALRSRVLVVDGIVRLEISADDGDGAPLTCSVAAGPVDDVEALVIEVASQVFPVGQPLVWAHLIALAPNDRLLVIAADHLVFDGWSAGIVVEELIEAYIDGGAALAARAPAPTAGELYALDDAPGSEAQRERALAYWAERLRDAPTFSFPADRAPAGEGRQRARRARATVPSRTLAGIRALAAAARTTPSAVLLAAYACVLARFGGEDDIVVGIPVVDRQFRGTEAAVGFLTTTLPVRLEARPAQPFSRVVAEVARRSSEAYAHSHVAFNDVVAELKPAREAGRNPLFSVWFNMLPASRARALPGLRVEDVTPPTLGALFDVGLYCALDGEAAVLTLVVDDDRFEPWRADAMLAALTSLLEQAVAAPEEPFGSHPLPAPAGPAPPAARPRDERGLLERIEAVARASPERPAVADSVRALTYGELLAEARRTAWSLHRAGVAPGDVVALSSTRSASLPAAMLGVIGAGATLLLLDRNALAARVAEYVDRAGARLVLDLDLDPPREPAGEGWPAGSGTASTIVVTSGSTGEPHAVRSPLDAVANFVDWHVAAFDLGERDRFALISGIGHDPVFRDVFTPLATGATLLVPDTVDAGAPHELLRWLRSERISVLHATPPVVRLLSATAGRDDVLPDLRTICFGGDLLTAADVTAARALAPGARLANFYGTTETPQAVSCFALQDGVDLPLRVPIGPGVAGAELVVATAAGVPAGVGELGEIHVRSRFLADGYVGEQELTTVRFSAAGPDGLRAFATGDLARPRPDGSLDFCGRSDRQHKVRGFRVECAEVERQLAGHPALAAAWATVLRDAAGEQVVAYAVPADPEAVPASADLRAYASGVLPDYMVPARIAVVPRLPTTANGKIDVAPLRAAPPVGAAAAPADSDTGELVRRVWQQILGVASVDVDANWFDLGGNSLTLIAVQQELERRLEREIPLLLLFGHTTIRSLAAALDGAGGGGERAPRTGDRQRRSDARRRRVEARRTNAGG